MSSALQDELECARLAIAWSHLLDQHENERIVALFADDGVLHSRTGVDAVGPEAIMAVLRKRSPNRVTRHVLAPPFVELTGADDARSVVSFIVYEGFKDQHEGSGPMPLNRPVTVGEFHHSYRRTPAGWRIASARSSAVFKQPD